MYSNDKTLHIVLFEPEILKTLVILDACAPSQIYVFISSNPWALK